MINTKPRPIDKLRDGSITVAIWKNVRNGRAFYSLTMTRTYKDEQGNFHDSDSFRGTEILRLQRLLSHAYDVIADLQFSQQNSQSVAA